MHPVRISPVSIARQAARSLAANDVFRMAGATAFFTTFALPPILMIIVRAFGIFLGRRSVGEALIGPLGSIFGHDGTASILQTIRSFRNLGQNYAVSVGIFIFLLFVATTLFKVIRGAINQLWCIRPLPTYGVRGVLISRAVSVAVILAGGLLFLVIQLAEAAKHLLDKYFSAATMRYLDTAFNVGTTAVVSTIWFYLLFTLLPDGRPARRVAVGGALFTGLLFTAGKTLLGVLLRPVSITNFYGVSGAFALVLLFLFYSALFLYAGAAVMEAWGNAAGTPVRAKSSAERYRVIRDGSGQGAQPGSASF